MDLDKVVEFLEKLASKLGITVEQLYNLYVKAQYALAIINLIKLAIVFIPLFSVILYAIRKYVKGDWDGEDAAAFAIITGVIFLLIFLIVGDCIGDALERLWIPEYVAAKELLEDLSGFKP